jgi:nucleoside-triphosphatase THEP1
MEQSAIIQAILSGLNVIVSAVPGSGKTTTVLTLAKAAPELRVLQLTYNSALKLEVRDKVVKHGLKNIEIHSYNSLAVKFYDKRAHTDTVLQAVCRDGMVPKSKRKYDVVAMDEVQDMNVWHFRLVTKFLRDMEIFDTARYLVLGDPKQCIYGYLGADSRYLTMMDTLLGKEFLRLGLSKSYRLDPYVCRYIGGIESHRDDDGKKVTLWIGNMWKMVKRLEDVIMEYDAGDVFVLSASVRSKNARNPIKMLENSLCKRGVRCYVSSSDDRLNSSIIEGKVVFTTFHACKGRERKLVVVVGFDSGYHEFYARNGGINPLYVALSRTMDRLILLQNEDKSGLSCFNGDGVVVYGTQKKVKEAEKIVSELSVTELVKWSRVEPSVTWLVEDGRRGEVEVHSCVDGEDVSMLVGTAIPAYVEHLRTGSSKLWRETRCARKTVNISVYLKLANIYESRRSGWIFKVCQLKQYEWLGDDVVADCIKVMDQHVPLGGEYEVFLNWNGLCGYVDYVVGDTIFELKCVTELRVEHMAQLLLYMYLHHKNRGGDGPKGVLLNVFTGENWKVEYSPEIEVFVDKLMVTYRDRDKVLTDDEFLAQIGTV